MSFQSSTKSFKNYFGLAMALFYLFAGIAFLFTSVLIDVFPVNRKPIGFIFLAYAGFRFYMSFKNKKS